MTHNRTIDDAPDSDDRMALGPDEEITLIALGTALLRHRWRILRWGAVGAILPVAIASTLERTWIASASFVPQSADAGQSGLRSLAGQFGVSLAGGTAAASQSPEFYADLLTSAVILAPIVQDTVVLGEDGNTRRAMLDLLDVKSATAAESRERGIEALRNRIATSVSRATGVVKVTVKMPRASAALGVAQRLLEEVNRFNLQTRQSQAAEERRFVEARLATQRRVLIEAEERLGAFLKANRQFANAPSLMFAHDRLQREVALQQQVLVGLSQSFEEARIREARDVPVVTVIESPSLPARPNGRQRVLLAVLGALVGGFLGAVVAYVRDAHVRRGRAGDAETEQFSALLREARGDFARWFKRTPRA